jgi:hypothetical protein
LGTTGATLFGQSEELEAAVICCRLKRHGPYFGGSSINSSLRRGYAAGARFVSKTPAAAPITNYFGKGRLEAHRREMSVASPDRNFTTTEFRRSLFCGFFGMPIPPLH